ncbi:MAG: TrkH family potassium uptake protein [Bacteroidetes Order II. Incertae sedis bacterium]|nr:TrkH family potassium uptake protein [Bacteroidetes Order II. bacterium]
MLNYRIIVGIQGAILLVVGFLMLIPMMVGLGYGDADWWSFGGTAAICISFGVATWNIYRPDEELRIREAFAILTLAWVLVPLIAALPFVWSNVIPSFTDAYFEMMSGFTGTGATIMGGAGNVTIEELPYAFQFWRAFSQWLGGISMIVLATSLLPLLGVGGMQLFKSEVSGPAIKRLSYRVSEISKRVWGLYILFTIILALLLLPVMSFFDAVTTALATISTGGFSTRTDSLAAFDSVYVEMIVMLFMIIGAINFNFLYQALVLRNLKVFSRTVFKVFLAIMGIAIVLLTLALWRPIAEYFPPLQLTAPEYMMYPSFGDALRFSSFQVISVFTTTGFTNTDIHKWMPFTTFLLITLAMIGGMAGSSAGGIKILRLVLVVKQILREIQLMIHPRAIIAIRLDHEVVAPDISRNVTSFVFIYFATFICATGIMTFTGVELVDAAGIVISCLSGVGPPIGAFGTSESYAVLPDIAKWFLSLVMVLGRLEIFTVLLVLMPSYWRR